MSLDSNPSQNEDIEFLNTSTQGETKSPIRKRATHQSPTKGLNTNNNNNKSMTDQDSDSPAPNWNWKINSQHLDPDNETESQPLQLNRKNKSQKESLRESPQATQEDKSADESKSRIHSNNNSQNIDMTLELAKERLRNDDNEGSQENMELRRQKLELLKQMEEDEVVQNDNNDPNEDLTLDPNATIDVNNESVKRKELGHETNEPQPNANTTNNKKPKLMIDLLEEKPDTMIEEDINATLPFQLGEAIPKQKPMEHKEAEKKEDENTQPMDEEISLKRKKKLQNSTDQIVKDDSKDNRHNNNTKNQSKEHEKSEENSQNTQPMEIDPSLKRLKKANSEKNKKDDDGSDTEPLTDDRPLLKRSTEKLATNSLEDMLGPCSVREVKQDNSKKSDFVDWQDELDKKLAGKLQAENQTNSNNNHMTEQERLDFELAQKLQNEIDQAKQQEQKPEPVKQKEEPSPGEICLSENEKKMFEYFKKKKEQEEIDRKLAEELAKQLEEEDKKFQQQQKKPENNSNNNAEYQDHKKVDEPKKPEFNINNNARDNNQNMDNSNKANKHTVEIEYPNYWEKQATDQQLFTLDKNSNEFQSIANRFYATASGAEVEDYQENSSGYYISKIQRNQNRRLWMWYLLRKREIQETSKVANEKFLFHGSGEENYEAILKEGLDLRLANAEGSIGAGIYFAPLSSTSMDYISGHDKSRMLLCRVTLGIVGGGEYGLKRPPEGCDSVGAEEEMFVVFDSHQAYPEYIITFSQNKYNNYDY